MRTTSHKSTYRSHHGRSHAFYVMRERSLDHVESIIKQSAARPASMPATDAGTSADMSNKSFPTRFLNILIKAMKQTDPS